MVQFDLKTKIHATRNKQNICRMMITSMLCQWDFDEQIEKMVRLFVCTSEKCSRKFYSWVHYAHKGLGR
jgi:hypothetical protein